MPEPIDLGYAARLTPKEAVAYFRAKGYSITWNWYEQMNAAHARAFTVAKAVRRDVLETLREEVARAIADGVTREEFIRTLTPRLQKLGWWGKQIVVDSQGNAKEITLGSPRRLATIWNVNTRVAYNAGRYAQLMNSAEEYPYWQYVAVMDSRTRPAHAALNGLVFRYDDPFWQTHYPPNGWSCRCRVRALSAARLKSLGLSVTDGAPFVHTHEVEAGVDETTGEVFHTPSATFDNGKVKMTPDVGWSYHPGAAAFGTDASLIRKMLELKSDELREQMVQSLNNSPSRQAAFRDWAQDIMRRRRAGHEVATLGVMSGRVAQAVMHRTGTPPARLLVMGAKNVLHADSQKHHDDNIALSAEEFGRLPEMLANPQAVLWDRRHNNLMYIAGTTDSTVLIAVNAPYSIRRQKDRLDVVINAYKVKLFDIQKAIEGGKLEIIEGDVKADR